MVIAAGRKIRCKNSVLPNAVFDVEAVHEPEIIGPPTSSKLRFCVMLILEAKDSLMVMDVAFTAVVELRKMLFPPIKLSVPETPAGPTIVIEFALVPVVWDSVMLLPAHRINPPEAVVLAPDVVPPPEAEISKLLTALPVVEIVSTLAAPPPPKAIPAPEESTSVPVLEAKPESDTAFSALMDNPLAAVVNEIFGPEESVMVPVLEANPWNETAFSPLIETVIDPAAVAVCKLIFAPAARAMLNAVPAMLVPEALKVFVPAAPPAPVVEK
jgi:hypothetical protein